MTELAYLRQTSLHRVSRKSSGLSLANLCLLLPWFLASCGAASTTEPANTDGEMPTNHPGAAAYSPELQSELLSALQAKGSSYVPRTHHLDDDGRPNFTNRLILEDSPYLIQHAHNPVNWYPWGTEPFELAKTENKPIFLSIGYSTCHWCHVMERESFEDLEIARLMNQYFICIKIDRERRPDIDAFYMTAVQMLTGRGGWPMSSFLTPEGDPFFGGTYFPPQRFATLLQQVHAAWEGQRPQLLEQAAKISERVQLATTARGQAAAVGQEAVQKAVDQITGNLDTEFGGFGSAPKFPHEPGLLLLLSQALRTGNQQALHAADVSLDAMARGGIYDQVGGGFHRYSVDAQWLVPHFEKMLYNQAHLTRAYLAAHQLAGKTYYARIVRQTLDYFLREMTSPAGAFYSATDADSAGAEGEFFVWTPDELRHLLSEDDAALAIDLWSVTQDGNFEGKNILHLAKSYEDYARSKSISVDHLLQRIDGIRDLLWKAREEREHPLRDDKIVTAWNGMMITSLAEASEVLGEPRYLEAARRAANFLWDHNRRENGELLRVHLAGNSSGVGLQNDYAYFAEALITLYDLSGEEVWLERARELADSMLQKFWDEGYGGFFMTAAGVDPNLRARPKSPSDNAIPSGNSVGVRALGMLATRTEDASYGDRANQTLSAFAEKIQQYPAGFGYMLMAADGLLHGEPGPRQYGASGHVKATARLVTADRLETRGVASHVEIDLEIRDGWHINANQPLSDNLIPTEVTIDQERAGLVLSNVAYPTAETVRLGFQDEPLAVYQGKVQLSGTVARTDPEDDLLMIPIHLRLQACNDRVCLRPEDLVLEIPAGSMP